MSPLFPYQSKVPAAIEALVALWQGAFAANAKVLVKDGQWRSEESRSQIICVAWSGFVPGYEYPSRSLSDEFGEPVVTVETAQEGLGPSVRETMAIKCASIVRLGDKPDLTQARADAYANQAICGAAVANSRNLGGVVARVSMVASHNLSQALQARGSLVIVQFDVGAEAYAQQ